MVKMFAHTNAVSNLKMIHLENADNLTMHTSNRLQVINLSKKID